MFDVNWVQGWMLEVRSTSIGVVASLVGRELESLILVVYYGFQSWLVFVHRLERYIKESTVDRQNNPNQ
jgi:hypothetical protein